MTARARRDKDGMRGVDVPTTTHRPLTPQEQRAGALAAAGHVLAAMPRADRGTQRAALAELLDTLGLHNTAATAKEAS